MTPASGDPMQALPFAQGIVIEQAAPIAPVPLSGRQATTAAPPWQAKSHSSDADGQFWSPGSQANAPVSAPVSMGASEPPSMVVALLLAQAAAASAATAAISNMAGVGSC